mgnify:CR=1 FL=1
MSDTTIHQHTPQKFQQCQRAHDPARLAAIGYLVAALRDRGADEAEQRRTLAAHLAALGVAAEELDAAWGAA